MKFRIKMRKGSGIFVSIAAGIAFVFMVITRFDFPVEKVLEFLWICLLMVVAMIALAAPIALLIRWWSNRRNSQ